MLSLLLLMLVFTLVSGLQIMIIINYEIIPWGIAPGVLQLAWFENLAVLDLTGVNTN